MELNQLPPQIPGETPLPERYEMMAELGRGGMGIVYKARDRETGEILAIKILKPEIAFESQVLERFKNELRLAHRITHRNVARLYEFHRSGDTAFVSMEFVEGKSLRELLRRSGRLDPERGIEIARQIIAGIGEAHRQSIVHRDLKPENIMLTASGEVKVMDFGISRSYAAGVTSTGAIIGTPAYMAPEQAEAKPTDQRTDVYALGLILYEMFTGKTAFSGETPVSVALKQIRERPAAPGTIAPGLPKHIERAIEKCLEKNPADRFQSVEELERALEGAPPAPVRGRRRWLVPAMATVAILAIAGIAGWLWMNRQTDSLRLAVDQYTLKNGLPVVLSVDHGAPVFTLTVAYSAGIRRDPPGKSGLAFVMAQVMQHGSENVGDGEHESLVEQAGGNHAYGIQPELAYFSSTLPANQLEMAMFLESDRMRALEITQQGLDASRAWVLEVIAGQQSRPYQGALMRLFQMSIGDVLRYGTADGVNNITLDDVADFYKTYYVPSNAALTLAGDFDPKRARELIERYFGGVPARPAPAPLVAPARTVETGETMTDPAAHVPVVMIAYQAPPLTNAPDWFPLHNLMELLVRAGFQGSASRLQSRLVQDAGLASAVEGELTNYSGPNIFWVLAVAVPGKDLGQVERLAIEEIDRIGKMGISQQELDRLRAQALLARDTEMVTTEGRTLPFAELVRAGAPAASLNDWEDGVRNLTADELRRVVKKYLTPEHRSVLVVQPGAMRVTP